ncbi:MAG: methionyl-tRNA formyltransferase [Anaerotruncus sp.]|nr:MAG: methionyl-tRNA formyltransferase [Anaerotruncus sp.]
MQISIPILLSLWHTAKILPPSVLSIPKYGCINVHASLLPKYRGAAPIQWAVLNGDSETGVCIMQMDEGLDTGNIISEVKTNIDINETSEQLFLTGFLLSVQTRLLMFCRKSKRETSALKKQIGESSYASMISRDLSPINWNKSAFDIHNQIRGLNSWPGASTVIAGKQVKIHASLLSDMNGAKPGEIIAVGKDITVSCGDGHCIDITELQPAGKKKMDSKSFAAGNKISVGDIIGS